MEPFLTIVLVFFIGLLASFIGATTGGGGLLSIPFLMLLGLPAETAIATNIFGAIGMNIGSLEGFIGKKQIHWRYVASFSFLALIGGYVGAVLLVLLNKERIAPFLGGILLALLPFSLLTDFGLYERIVTKTKQLLGYCFYFLVTIIAGFLGAGAALLVYDVLIYFFGFELVHANATNRIPWLLVSIIAFVVFASAGFVNYFYGAVLFLSMLLGGYIGTKTVLRKGTLWMKTVYAIIVFIAGIKLLLF